MEFLLNLKILAGKRKMQVEGRSVYKRVCMQSKTFSIDLVVVLNGSSKNKIEK